MANEDKENKGAQLYRDLINEEVKSPEVQKAKRDFIQENFSEPMPLFIFKPNALIPVTAIAGALVFLLLFVRGEVGEVPVVPGTTLTTQAVEAPEVKTPTIVSSIKTESPIPSMSTMPSVEVKSLESSVGPTMVYQKLYHEVPMTIVWVFAKGAMP